MNTLPNDLTNLIFRFLDAAECNLLGIQMDRLDIEEAVKTKSMNFILYYAKHNKYDLIEFATCCGCTEFINLILDVDEYQKCIAITKAYIRSNDIDTVERRTKFTSHKDMDYIVNQLMLTAINCKNKSVIKFFKTNYWFLEITWAPVHFEAEKMLRLDYNGDVKLLDFVFAELIVDNDFDVFINEHVCIYFENWQLGLDIMIEKGDHACAEYFRQKLEEKL